MNAKRITREYAESLDYSTRPRDCGQHVDYSYAIGEVRGMAALFCRRSDDAGTRYDYRIISTRRDPVYDPHNGLLPNTRRTTITVR